MRDFILETLTCHNQIYEITSVNFRSQLDIVLFFVLFWIIHSDLCNDWA